MTDARALKLMLNGINPSVVAMAAQEKYSAEFPHMQEEESRKAGRWYDWATDALARKAPGGYPGIHLGNIAKAVVKFGGNPETFWDELMDHKVVQVVFQDTDGFEFSEVFTVSEEEKRTQFWLNPTLSENPVRLITRRTVLSVKELL